MRKLMVLAVVLAMILVAAAPAIAQSGGGAQEDQYAGGGPTPLLACEDFATQEEAQQFLDENPDDPYNIDLDGNGIACEFDEKTGTEGEDATLSYELAVDGQCAADATFFGENNLVGAADYVGTSQLTDSDGDGVYTYSEDFPVGSELDGLRIVQGTGTENLNSEFFRGPVPGEPVTPIKSFDPVTLEEDTTLSAAVDCDDLTKPQQEDVTLSFELAVEGQCPSETNFFAGMSTSHGYSVPLADPDGDSVYTGSIDFGKGVNLLEVGMYRGAGIQEGPYGQIPVGEPETIRSFGNLIAEKDETFSATISCDETTTTNPGSGSSSTAGSTTGSVSGNSSASGTDENIGTENYVQAVQGMLPDTGGVSLMLLGGGFLLIGGGLVIRRIIG